MILHKQVVNTGSNLSPLDLIHTAVEASPDWSVKKLETDVTDGFKTVLWVEAINTTNTDRIGIIFNFTQGVSLKATVCEYIDLVEDETNQPNTCPSIFYTSQNYVKYYGQTRGVQEDVVIIDRDYLYVAFAGPGNVVASITKEAPNVVGFFVSTINKAHDFTKGIVFATNSLSGVSYKEVFYIDSWYGDSTTTSLNNKQSRLNATVPSELYTAPGLTDSYFFNAPSVHINQDTLADDTEMVLLGYIPGIYVSHDEYKTVYGLNVKLGGNDYVGYPDFGNEAANIMLFPE